MAVDYGRKEESKIPMFSWKSLIVWGLIVIGSILIQWGNEKDKPAPRIHIEQQSDPKPSFQQIKLN
jgi:hypothetical protein